jgi:preprotein translocase subunit SecE
MDENKKEDLKEKKAKTKEGGGFSEWINGILGEFKRITWPDRKSLVKMVVTVIVTSAVFGGIIVFYDFALAAGYDALVSLFS